MAGLGIARGRVVGAGTIAGFGTQGRVVRGRVTVRIADELTAAGVDRDGLRLAAAGLPEDTVAGLLLRVSVRVARAVAGILAVGVPVVLGLAVVVVSIRLIGTVGILAVAGPLGDLALDIV